MSQKHGRIKKEHKTWKYLKAPFRILAKARDFYMKGMAECSDRVIHGNLMGCPTALPRSFSASSTKSSSSAGDNDLRELIRAASTSSLGNYRIEADHIQRKQQGRHGQIPNRSPFNVPRSQSVGIGRIDENEPCEFQQNAEVSANEFPRSRSYAVGKRKTTIF